MIDFVWLLRETGSVCDDVAAPDVCSGLPLFITSVFVISLISNNGGMKCQEV